MAENNLLLKRLLEHMRGFLSVPRFLVLAFMAILTNAIFEVVEDWEMYSMSHLKVLCKHFSRLYWLPSRNSSSEGPLQFNLLQIISRISIEAVEDMRMNVN